ncbi:MAG: cell division protein ZapA [Treponematales bacterium]
MPKSDLCIDVLGTRLLLSAEEDAAYLEGLLGSYRDALAEIEKKTGLTDPLKIAVLTGFELCDKIKKLSARTSEEAEVERIALGLLSRIDAVVKDAPDGDGGAGAEESDSGNI